MGEENNILGFGNVELFFAPKDTANFKELPIVEDSTFIGYDEGVESPPSSLKIGPLSIKGEIKLKEREYLDLLEKTWDGLAIPQREAIREVSFVIDGEPHINRPKNLKYPNKKRARRIWKKWCNRFGVTPSRYTVIPKAILSVTPAFRNNQAYYDIEAVVEKGDLDAERK